MICPECQSSNLKKNSPKRGKQNYLCKNWIRQFIDSYLPLGYPDFVKNIAGIFTLNEMVFLGSKD
jgi:insertion element IS1 protein InsB